MKVKSDPCFPIVISFTPPTTQMQPLSTPMQQRQQQQQQVPRWVTVFMAIIVMVSLIRGCECDAMMEFATGDAEADVGPDADADTDVGPDDWEDFDERDGWNSPIPFSEQQQHHVQNPRQQEPLVRPTHQVQPPSQQQEQQQSQQTELRNGNDKDDNDNDHENDTLENNGTTPSSFLVSSPSREEIIPPLTFINAAKNESTATFKHAAGTDFAPEDSLPLMDMDIPLYGRAAYYARAASTSTASSKMAMAGNDMIVTAEHHYFSDRVDQDFDDRTLLDVFGEVAKEYLTQRVIPETDAECRWDWRSFRCEPACECLFDSKFGDYHLGRSCRRREPRSLDHHGDNEQRTVCIPIHPALVYGDRPIPKRVVSLFQQSIDLIRDKTLRTSRRLVQRSTQHLLRLQQNTCTDLWDLLRQQQLLQWQQQQQQRAATSAAHNTTSNKAQGCLPLDRLPRVTTLQRLLCGPIDLVPCLADQQQQHR